ncbi:MAG: ABC transporter ATP-binding protein [Spirochaetaceae bacterium]|nr:ABC transporter ATP-binding protein [Spirochaetaceae bacterium]
MLGFACMVGQNYALLRGSEFLRLLLDEIADGANERTVVLGLIAQALAFAVGVGVCMYGMRRLIIGVSRDVEYELRDVLFRKLLALDFDFYQRRRTGDIISRCTNDLNDVRTLLGPGIMYLPDGLSRLALFAPVLVGLHAPMAGALGALVVALVAVILVITPRLRPRFRRVQELVAAINDRVWQIVTGINTVKLYGLAAGETERFRELNRRYITANVGLARTRGVLWPLLQFMYGLATLLLLLLGGGAVIRGTLTIGELLQFAAIVGWLTFPVLSLGWVSSLIQQGITAMERIRAILDHPVAVRPAHPVPVPAGPLAVSADGVSYRFPNADRDALTGVQLALRAGRTLGITGGVGSGKSSLVLLLAGIAAPSGGTLKFNGVDATAIDPFAYRGRIAYVPQEPFLFSATVAENIAMGSEEEVSRDRIVAAARLAAVDQDITRFPDGYDTLVGERGITLSGGQRQRVAIARALVRDSDLLIMDDALSSVDSDTETAILTNLRGLRSSRTIVIVSHRVSALQLADRVAVMEGGTVVEAGSHKRLLRARGRYARLAELQQLEAALR